MSNQPFQNIKGTVSDWWTASLAKMRLHNHMFILDPVLPPRGHVVTVYQLITIDMNVEGVHCHSLADWLTAPWAPNYMFVYI